VFGGAGDAVRHPRGVRPAAGRKVRLLFDALTYCAIIVPGIVIGISTLIAFISLFDLINPLLASWMPSVPRLNMGFFTVIAAHSLFTMALVMVIVRSRVDSWTRRCWKPRPTSTRRPCKPSGA
jgi:ABC-type spermidine/putrescine transport system permease subunit II